MPSNSIVITLVTYVAFVLCMFLGLSFVFISARAFKDSTKKTLQGTLWVLLLATIHFYVYDADTLKPVVAALFCLLLAAFLAFTYSSSRGERTKKWIKYAVAGQLLLSLSYLSMYIVNDAINLKKWSVVLFSLLILSLVNTRITPSKFVFGMWFGLSAWISFVLFTELTGLLISLTEESQVGIDDKYAFATDLLGLSSRLGASIDGPESLAIITLVWMTIPLLYLKNKLILLGLYFSGVVILLGTADRFALGAAAILALYFLKVGINSGSKIPKRSRYKFPLVIFFAAGIILYSNSTTLSKDASTLNGRVLIWRWVLDNLGVHGWLVGNGAWPNQPSAFSQIGIAPVHAHNGFLDPLWTLGILGMATAMWICVSLWIGRPKQYWRQEFVFSFVFFMVLFFCFSGPVFSFPLPHGAMLLVGTAIALGRIESSRDHGLGLQPDRVPEIATTERQMQ